MAVHGVVGVDVGASTIKGAIVDVDTGKLIGEREKEPTPKPASPAAVADVVATIVDRLGCSGSVGIALPCVVRGGVAESAANIDPTWIGTDAVELFESALDGRPVTILNDADAAGLAESRFGAARHTRGSVLMFTFGTGIGSALIHDGRVVPNTEFGHLMIGDELAENLAANSVREEQGLSWSEWADRVKQLLELAVTVTRPDLIVIGGGISEPERAMEWEGSLTSSVPVVAAALANRAGMVGAALHAHSRRE
jgi:polyphosphate glucokinase